jgi:hypothetical protein
VTRLKVKLQAQAADDRSQGEVHRCCQPLCPNLSMRSAGTGFSLELCERHTEHLSRHGHASIGSIPGPMLRPYVDTARRWITSEQALGNVRVQGARTAIWGLLQTAGNAPSALDIKWWSADDKGRACFARLREKGVTPETILARYMGLVALLMDDPWQPQSEDYKLTQAGKSIWRLASGTHRSWTIALPTAADTLGEGEDAPITKASLHVYPRPQGRPLRIVGHSLDEACGSLAEGVAPTIILAKEQRYGRHECHTLGYEPTWYKATREKHQATLKKRQQAQAEQERQEAIRQLLSDAAPTLSWHARR